MNDTLLWEAEQGLELPDFLRAGYDRFSGQYPKFHKMDALSKLGWLAAEVLLKDTRVNTLPPEQVGMVLSNRSSSLDTDLRYYATVKEFASPALFVYTLPNIVMGEIAIRHGFKGENTFFVSAAFDTVLMSTYPAQLLAETPLQACICGWVEVMEQQYEVALFLVENKQSDTAQPLTAAALSSLYQQTNS
ncbi:beta-ketoacyl synthase N-terminal-like domain-containing protein [Chitinophaga sp.]|uniref:beta-ketoacyl synthase N-terminal-like domain-containing protein n=1 Tax=Chitinophaga sp. TaxID=1869181 RepID=UPI002F94464E